ncbi:hypothetical protein [Pseudorhodoplanes sp.]|uniref:hypothetical protein n=1 Tax=Pseudorhodoplanes sp. TaxID=1934341 RepID=UPI00391D208C
MKGIRRSLLLVPVALSVVALTLPAMAQTASTERVAARSKPTPSRTAAPEINGHVYLLRGLLNIFSLGMDDLASKVRARGISASVHNHSEWQTLADGIVAKHKARQHGPIVLVGHSLGADAVMFMAEYLGKKGVPVALVVPFDGTGSFAASSNVRQVYNLTQRDYAHMRRGPGFRGKLENVDVSGQGYGHIDIDKSPRLHALVLGRIQTVIRTRGAPAVATDEPARPRPAPAAAATPASATPASSDAPASTGTVPASAPAKPEAEAAPSARASAAAALPAAKPTSAEPVAAKPAQPTAASTDGAAGSGARPAPAEPAARPAPAASRATSEKPALRF